MSAAEELARLADANPELQFFAVEANVLQEAFRQAIVTTLRVDTDFQHWVAAQARQEVNEQASKSEHAQTIRAEVSKALARYPALGDDPALHDVVSKAITDHMMMRVR